MVKESVNLLERGAPEEYATTTAYSVLKRKKVHTAVAFEILDSDASSTAQQLRQGLAVAVTKAPVVYTNVGPIEQKFCEQMAAAADTAFVVVSGNDYRELDPSENPACISGNILFVAAFDQVAGAITSANWGQQVRIAAPSMGILATIPGGARRLESNGTMGSSLVAGRLAVFARTHRELRGAILIDRFLTENTEHLPALDGKIPGGLALKGERLVF